MRKTERGYSIYTEFKDRYGRNVRVQKSSLATEDCVWIFPEIHEHMGTHLAGAHLTKRMAKRVIKALQTFVDEE